MLRRKSIGIVGCGAIGRAILRAVDAGRLAVSVGGVSSRTESTAREFIATLKSPVPLVSQTDVIAASDLVIEAAGGHVVDSLARETFAAGKDLMVISIGALLDHEDLFGLAGEAMSPDHAVGRHLRPRCAEGRSGGQGGARDAD